MPTRRQPKETCLPKSPEAVGCKYPTMRLQWNWLAGLLRPTTPRKYEGGLAANVGGAEGQVLERYHRGQPSSHLSQPNSSFSRTCCKHVPS
jgi:hypothetical protein